jgi:hypothetical protein
MKNEYDRDVEPNARRIPSSSQSGSSGSSGAQHFAAPGPNEHHQGCHKDLNIHGKIRECRDNDRYPITTSLAIISDVTKSRGKDVDIIFQKLPRLMGKNGMLGLVPGLTISIAAVGDATAGDLAPLQVGQFEADNRLDRVLEHIWAEGGGGGTGQESYQLPAFFYARRVSTDAWEKRGQKGIVFFLGDEGFYPAVSRGEVKRILGVDIPEDIPSAQIFRELQERNDVFLIFPRSSWEERKGDIDQEIEQRVKRAGGMYGGVDMRFSLIWHNRNDLDLHVKTPSGEHIYYGNKRVSCGGYLDVDMNVRGETNKPVENTRWEKGTGRRGNYEVWVENYGFHEGNRDATPFKVEIEINGEISHFEGEAPAGRTQDGSKVLVGNFFFDPKATTKQTIDQYALYDDAVIRAQWASVIPPENILTIQDPKAIVDTILAVLAVKYKGMPLPHFLEVLKEDGQTEERIADVRTALAALAEMANAPQVDLGSVRPTSPLKRKPSGSRRIR